MTMVAMEKGEAFANVTIATLSQALTISLRILTFFPFLITSDSSNRVVVATDEFGRTRFCAIRDFNTTDGQESFARRLKNDHV